MQVHGRGVQVQVQVSGEKKCRAGFKGEVQAGSAGFRGEVLGWLNW